MGLIMKKTREEIFETMQRVFAKKKEGKFIHIECNGMPYDCIDEEDVAFKKARMNRDKYVGKDPRKREKVEEARGQTKSEEN
jgi:hypothetical protein